MLTIHQYATLMSPNDDNTAVCGSSVFCYNDWERQSLVSIFNRVSVSSLAGTNTEAGLV